jgi:hypothetical protein
VHQALEREALAAPADRSEKVNLSVNVFAYSGMPQLLTADQK